MQIIDGWKAVNRLWAVSEEAIEQSSDILLRLQCVDRQRRIIPKCIKGQTDSHPTAGAPGRGPNLKVQPVHVICKQWQ